MTDCIHGRDWALSIRARLSSSTGGDHVRRGITTAKARRRFRNRKANACGWRCPECGCVMVAEQGADNSVTVDHVIPRSKGGQDVRGNLAILCYACNQAKADADP